MAREREFVDRLRLHKLRSFSPNEEEDSPRDSGHLGIVPTATTTVEFQERTRSRALSQVDDARLSSASAFYDSSARDDAMVASAQHTHHLRDVGIGALAAVATQRLSRHEHPSCSSDVATPRPTLGQLRSSKVDGKNGISTAVSESQARLMGFSGSVAKKLAAPKVPAAGSLKPHIEGRSVSPVSSPRRGSKVDDRADGVGESTLSSRRRCSMLPSKATSRACSRCESSCRESGVRDSGVSLVSCDGLSDEEKDETEETGLRGLRAEDSGAAPLASALSRLTSQLTREAEAGEAAVTGGIGATLGRDDAAEVLSRTVVEAAQALPSAGLDHLQTLVTWQRSATAKLIIKVEHSLKLLLQKDASAMSRVPATPSQQSASWAQSQLALAFLSSGDVAGGRALVEAVRAARAGGVDLSVAVGRLPVVGGGGAVVLCEQLLRELDKLALMHHRSVWIEGQIHVASLVD